jgi:hypothetical protein
VFSFRPHRSSATCRNQEGSTELSFTQGSQHQNNPITTARLQGLLNAKNGSTAAFSIFTPTNYASRFGLPHYKQTAILMTLHAWQNGGKQLFRTKKCTHKDRSFIPIKLHSYTFQLLPVASLNLKTHTQIYIYI